MISHKIGCGIHFFGCEYLLSKIICWETVQGRGGRGTRFELLEEWDHSENHAPLYSAVGLCNTPPEVLDITYAGWHANRWISRCDDEHECGGDDLPLLPTRVLAIKSESINHTFDSHAPHQ
jgi:hypothetical protein